MIERFIQKPIVGEVQKLYYKAVEVSTNREWTFSPEIQAVLVLSQSEAKPWMKHMDRDRRRAGVAVVREVTVATKARGLKIAGELKQGQKLTTKDIEVDDVLRDGPFYVYNGVHSFRDENSDFRAVMQTDVFKRKIPHEKVVVLDNIKDGEKTAAIKHTGDQVLSLFQTIADPESPLYDIETVATVQHIPDLIRNTNYLRYYNDAFESTLGRRINFFVYAIQSRKGLVEGPDGNISTYERVHVDSEIPRLVEYYAKGHLASSPEDVQF